MYRAVIVLALIVDLSSAFAMPNFLSAFRACRGALTVRANFEDSKAPFDLLEIDPYSLGLPSVSPMQWLKEHVEWIEFPIFQGDIRVDINHTRRFFTANLQSNLPINENILQNLEGFSTLIMLWNFGSLPNEFLIAGIPFKASGIKREELTARDQTDGNPWNTLNIVNQRNWQILRIYYKPKGFDSPSGLKRPEFGR
jgi:hypothetical protein